jgi:hypothetical protein
MQEQASITHRRQGKVTTLTREGIKEKSLTIEEQEKMKRENAIVHIPIGEVISGRTLTNTSLSHSPSHAQIRTVTRIIISHIQRIKNEKVGG